jgi:hypothetical protein
MIAEVGLTHDPRSLRQNHVTDYIHVFTCFDFSLLIMLIPTWLARPIRMSHITKKPRADG